MNEFWKGKRVFVTGATGFIGTWVVKELVDNGANVFCLVKELNKDSNFEKLGLNSKTTLLFGDLLDFNFIKLSLDKHQIDTVLHLAAQPLVQLAQKNPAQTLEVNIMGTVNVLEACRFVPNVKSIVIASSDKAYGSADKLPYDESFKLKGEYPYDVSKSCTDLIAQAYGKTYSMPIGITRCANIYGGGDLNFDRIIPETMMHILKKEDILIRSNGKFIREFFYVKDAAYCYLLLAQKVVELGFKGEAFNFGTDSPTSIIDLVNEIIKVSGEKNVKVNILNTAKAEIKDQYLSSAKAKKVLNFKPKYNLSEGLNETYEWYKEFFKNEK